MVHTLVRQELIRRWDSERELLRRRQTDRQTTDGRAIGYSQRERSLKMKRRCVYCRRSCRQNGSRASSRRHDCWLHRRHHQTSSQIFISSWRSDQGT